MPIRLQVASLDGEFPVAAEIRLPSDGDVTALSPRGARQLADRLMRFADLCDEMSKAE